MDWLNQVNPVHPTKWFDKQRSKRITIGKSRYFCICPSVQICLSYQKYSKVWQESIWFPITDWMGNESGLRKIDGGIRDHLLSQWEMLRGLYCPVLHFFVRNLEHVENKDFRSASLDLHKRARLWFSFVSGDRKALGHQFTFNYWCIESVHERNNLIITQIMA